MGASLQVPQHTTNALSDSGGTSIAVLHPCTMMYSVTWKMRGYWTQKWISICLFFTVFFCLLSIDPCRRSRELGTNTHCELNVCGVQERSG